MYGFSPVWVFLWYSRELVPPNKCFETGLLKILQPLHPDIPTHTRSLLSTPRLHNVIEQEGCGPGGDYVHLGIYMGTAGLHKSKH